MQLVDLLSQLEEPKFLRLFRHLINLRTDKLSDNLCLPPVALDFADAEMVARTVGKVSALRSWATTWVFQIEHAPPILWSNGDFFDDFVKKRLNAAFRNLKQKADPLNFLHAGFNDSDRPLQYPIAQGLEYYLFTNACCDLGEDIRNSCSRWTSDIAKSSRTFASSTNGAIDWCRILWQELRVSTFGM